MSYVNEMHIEFLSMHVTLRVRTEMMHGSMLLNSHARLSSRGILVGEIGAKCTANGSVIYLPTPHAVIIRTVIQ